MPHLHRFRSLTLLPVLLLAGCGNQSHPAPATAPVGDTPPTTVALQVAGTANDRFEQFGMTINTLTLTSATGSSVTLLSTPTQVNFLQVNGRSAPLATVQIPQGTYTSAAVTVNNASFTHIFLDSSQDINIATDEYGMQPTPPVVQLAAPITIGSTPVGLTLDLQATASGSFAITGGPDTYTINPTFVLRQFALADTLPASPQGLSPDLNAQVTAVDPTAGTLSVLLPTVQSGLVAEAASGPLFAVSVNASTVFEGEAVSLSSLQPGSFVNLDLARQSDGTLLATRLAVEDAAARDVVTGELAALAPSSPIFLSLATERQGPDLATMPVPELSSYKLNNTAIFQIAEEGKLLLADAPALPFSPQFTRQTWATGQRVTLGLGSTEEYSNIYPPVSTVTLMPQTIDATVLSAATDPTGVYTVQLGNLDPIVQLNLPAPYYQQLPSPQTVSIYTTAHVTITAGALLAGSSYRFTGLLFNDGGTLRMVCTSIEPGETP